MACMAAGSRRARRAAHAACPCAVRDQVLPDLELDMRKPAPFAVIDDGVVGHVADRVGFVVADDEIAFSPEQPKSGAGDARVAVVEHADMPRPRHVQEDGREAVHRDEHGGRPAACRWSRAAGSRRGRGERSPRARASAASVPTFWFPGMSVRSLRGGDRVGGVEGAVAVDDQARVPLQHGVRAQRRPQALRNTRRADVPGDVGGELVLGQTE